MAHRSGLPSRTFLRDVGLVLVAGRDVVDAVHPADHGLEGVDTSGDHIIWFLMVFCITVG